ncbi:hypothetical protein OE059_04450 [Exiguobacterium profundum]|uniref:Immunity protein 30 domain-containing protein n=1 Tax=Exiguobacterium profundum TaxID=307643 RepID=A0ABY8B4U6_9BACL|nr:hypothetical protein [Exiguobacterium profundum]WED56113.1 hypothetical protein OE059_04450 [Exiguobacterium profundum]
MSNNLETLIVSGRFKEVKDIYQTTDFETFKNDLLTLAYDNEHLSNYSVLVYLLLDTEDDKLHDLAFQVRSQPLCHIEGAYTSSLYHAQRAVDLTDAADVKRLENLLFLNIVPEKIVSDEQAKSIAEKILVLDPTNEVAKDTLY